MGVRGSVALAVAMTFATAAFAATTAAAAPVTSRVSFELDGSELANPSFNPSISADGNQIAYEVGRGDARSEPPRNDVYLYDRTTGKTEWISAAPLDTPGDGSSEEPSISADGRFVAFSSSSSNLVVGDTNNRSDVFVRDRETGALERISDPRSAGAHAFHPSIATGGRFVAFASDGPRAQLAGKHRREVLVHDRNSGESEVVSRTGPNVPTGSDDPAISAGGRFVAYVFGGQRVEVRDRELDRTEDVAAPGGRQTAPAISASGRFVAFTSDTRRRGTAQDLYVPGDVFVYDQQTGKTQLISVARNGRRGNAVSGNATISPHGRHVAFASRASNLIAHDTNDLTDVFVRDRRANTTRRVSISSARKQANNDSGLLRDGYRYELSMSAGGRFVAFPSNASNLVQSDTNDASDVFVRGSLSP
jgi:Tol biopolymer transport system component